MARRRRRDRGRRIVARRQLIQLERGYTAALKGWFQRLAAQIKEQNTIHQSSVERIIDSKTHELVLLIRAWMLRTAMLFGQQAIDHMVARTAAVRRKDAFDDFSSSVLEWLDTYALDQATTVAGNLKKKAKKVLQDAFDQGLGEEEAAQSLVDEIGGSVIEAERIARTEIHSAANQAADDGARATGLDMVKEWAATDDDRTRETHADADGQRQEMDDPFEVGDALLAYPGDPKGPAGEVINCRCVVLYHPRIDGEVFD